MLKLRINPIVAKDLKNIRDYIAEDNEEYAAKTIKEIYGKFENLQMFPGMGSDLSKRVSFRTDYKYAIWEDYVIIYKKNMQISHILLPNIMKNHMERVFSHWHRTICIQMACIFLMSRKLHYPYRDSLHC